MSVWSPVVYGRTHVADKWWRTLPAGIGTAHWVAAAVTDAVAGGAGLVRYRGELPENSPRFVLARGLDGTLVGLTCRARALSSELCQDEFGREIYCFVGWFTVDPVTRDIPRTVELFPAPDSWASQVYEQYSAPVWTASPISLEVQQSAPGPAPWPSPGGRPEPSGELYALERQVRVYPAAMGDQLWGSGTVSNGPFLLVTGWQRATQAPLERITHLSADDVATPTTAARPLPRPEPDRAVPPKADQGFRQDSRQDSHLGATRMGQQYRASQQASQQAARSQAPQSSSFIEHLIDWLFHIFNSSQPSPHQPSPPVQRPTRPPSDPPRGEAAPADTSTATSPGKTGTGSASAAATPANPASEPGRSDAPPAAPQSPQSPAPPPPSPGIELPARRGTAKPFEGLD